MWAQNSNMQQTSATEIKPGGHGGYISSIICSRPITVFVLEQCSLIKTMINNGSAPMCVTVRLERMLRSMEFKEETSKNEMVT